MVRFFMKYTKKTKNVKYDDPLQAYVTKARRIQDYSPEIKLVSEYFITEQTKHFNRGKSVEITLKYISDPILQYMQFKQFRSMKKS